MNQVFVFVNLWSEEPLPKKFFEMWLWLVGVEGAVGSLNEASLRILVS